MKPIVPKKSKHQGVPDSLSCTQTNFTIFSAIALNDCWKCEDTPCIKIEANYNPGGMKLPGSNLPEQNVCPEKAIAQSPEGSIKIDESKCIGCALCVMACPVNAIVLGPNGIPQLRTSALEDVGNQFQARRLQRATELTKSPSQVTKRLVKNSALTTNQLISADFDGRSIQVYIRNIFIKYGFITRIRIEGDTNDSFEIVAENADSVHPIEIAIGGDSLDSTRRIMSGCAKVIAKKSVEIEKLRPLLIVDELPNSRSDIYRILEDMRKYLGLDVKIIPLQTFQILLHANIDINAYLDVPGNYPSSEWSWRALQLVTEVHDSNIKSLMLAK